MGWNFGGAVIDFDFHTVVDTRLEPELKQLRTGAETPEEERSKALIDAGVVALEELELTAVPADAPIAGFDATSRDFGDYAVGMVGGKTLILGRALGLDQDSRRLVATYEKVSRERGTVLAFWINDASDTHIFSVFRDGSRVRFRSSGPGLDDDDGARIAGEPEESSGGCDRVLGVLEAMSGCSFADLLELKLERFEAC